MTWCWDKIQNFKSIYIAKRWKQPKDSSIDDWLNKMWYRNAMKYYSAIKVIKFWYILNMGKSRKHYPQWNKPDAKGQIFYDFYVHKVLRVGKFIDRKNNGHYLRLKGDES